MKLVFSILIYLICLSLASLSANGQVNKDSNKLIEPILTQQILTDSGYRVTTVTTYDYPPVKTALVHCEPLTLGVTYFTEMGNGGCSAYYHEFNTTFKTIYDRDEFKRFGIRNFPNIWH
jgi:hypothetical protein